MIIQKSAGEESSRAIGVDLKRFKVLPGGLSSPAGYGQAGRPAPHLIQIVSLTGSGPHFRLRVIPPRQFRLDDGKKHCRTETDLKNHQKSQIKSESPPKPQACSESKKR